MNQLITRSADGKWSFDAQSPIVSEWQEKYAARSLAARVCMGWRELEEGLEEDWRHGKVPS